MLGIGYMKAAPTTFVMHLKKGKVVAQGPGLGFWYFAPTSTLVAVPLASRDVPFTFQGTTADFQDITVQGQLTYRVVDAPRLGQLLDFTVDGAGRYRSEDPELLRDRLSNATQVLVCAHLSKLPLRQALKSGETLVGNVLSELRMSDAVQMLGLEVLDVSVLNLAPGKDMGRALEAEARESLQRQADEAIYARRRAAVEQERVIKETELNTEIAVEDKKRQIRTKQMEADISVEEQREALIVKRVANEAKDADGRAYALEATLKPVKDVDWKVLMAVGAGTQDPRMMIALAFRELAENAEKIGTLNMTPDLLQALLAPSGKGR